MPATPLPFGHAGRRALTDFHPGTMADRCSPRPTAHAGHGCARATLLLIALAALDVPATTRFVAAEGSSPAHPFASWETAARSIQDALLDAPEGTEIVVTNGVYNTGGRFAYNPIPGWSSTKRSPCEASTGPRSPGSKAARACAALSSGFDATLSGFTLTGGNAVLGGAVWCRESTWSCHRRSDHRLRSRRGPGRTGRRSLGRARPQLPHRAQQRPRRRGHLRIPARQLPGRRKPRHPREWRHLRLADKLHRGRKPGPVPWRGCRRRPWSIRSSTSTRA